MLCLTALVLHHDLPGHVLISGVVAIVALAAKSPFAKPIETTLLHEESAMLTTDSAKVKS